MTKLINKEYFIYFLLAIGFVLLASYSTSPLYPYCYGSDSAQFQTIGKGWLAGSIPYLDFFDHKGPLIFLLNALGYALTGSSTGIAILQIFFLFATLLALSHICKLQTPNLLYRFVAIFLFFCFLTSCYEGGNLTEEYCLPFVAWSLYGHIRFLSGAKRKNFLLQMFFYGLSFAVCLSTRVTNAIPICSGVLIICLIFLIKKEYRSFLISSFAFLSGVILLILPFCFYFSQYEHGLENLFFATISYNILYQQHMLSWLHSAVFWQWKDYLFIFLPSYSLFFVAFLTLRHKQMALSSFLILIAVLETYLFLTGALYPHYAIIALPQLILLTNILYTSQKPTFRHLRSIQIGFFIIFVIILLDFLPYFYRKTMQTFATYHNTDFIAYRELVTAIPNIDRKNTIAYADGRLKDFYLLYDISPCYKYFILQEWHARFSSQLQQDLIDTFNTCQAQYLLVVGSAQNIENLLKDHYLLLRTYKDYRLYRLTDF